MSFGTKQMAQSWAATIEGEMEQLKASGLFKPSGVIVGDLIDGYVGELYPLERGSASKTRDLRVSNHLHGHHSFGSLPIVGSGAPEPIPGGEARGDAPEGIALDVSMRGDSCCTIR